MNTVYLDNNSTTPVHPEVSDAIASTLRTVSGNPSSAHDRGRAAKRIVDDSREWVAALLGANTPREIIFTSGGTEADNLALGVISGRTDTDSHLITTRVEHEAVRRSAERLEEIGCRVTWLDANRNGDLDLAQLEDSLSSDSTLVSIMLANNETGVIFPIEKIVGLVKSRSRALIHVDAVNAAGKIPISMKDSGVDLMSISAHKLGGPKGIGALFVRDGVSIKPSMLGGGQESARRAGTEAVHQIVGFGVAARISSDLEPMKRLRSMRDLLESRLTQRFPDAIVNGRDTAVGRLVNTSNISFPGLNGEVILNLLDQAGVYVSTGSACNSENKSVSPVLKAMGVPFENAMGSIRISLGRENTERELSDATDIIIEVVRTVSSFSGR
jgi:cysteine desulfurase